MLQFLLTSDALQSLKLDTAPAGWDGMKYLLARDEQYYGVMLTMSADLTFWKQGAAYLRTLYDGGVDGNGKLVAGLGVQATAVLNVYEDDPNEFRTELVYRAKVDFLTYRSSEAGVQVKLKELGLATNLLSRADTDVDLLGATSLGGVALTATAPVTVELHSQVLRLRYAATQAQDNDLSPGTMYGNENDPSHEQLLYFGFDTPGDNDLALGAVSGGFVAGSADSVVPIYQAKESGTFVIELNISAHITATNNGQGPEFTTVEGDAYLKVITSAGTQAVRLVPDFYSGNLGGDYVADLVTGTVTLTADLEPGDSICLYARYFVHDIGGLGTSIRYRSTLAATMRAGSYLRITAQSTTAPTPCRGLLAHEALSRLTAAMADADNCFYSEYFGRTDSIPAYPVDGPGALRLLTNGFGLRGFPLPTDTYVLGADGVDPRKALTASFTTIYQGLNAQECLGAGFERRNGRATLRVEPRAYFFQATESLRLGTVQGLAKSPYTSLYFNQLEVGYQHWQSGEAVGLDEFNGQRTYTTPLADVKATYSILSGVNASGYLIEQARRQAFTTGTNAEGQADQEVFAISLRRTLGSFFIPKRAESYTLVTGILDPTTAYNLDLSPRRMLQKHGAWLASGLVPQRATSQRLTLGVVAGNDKLVSQRVGEAAPVHEHADVAIADLPTPTLVAETYEFTALLGRAALRALAKAPYGLVSFLDGQGQRKRGYLLKAEIAPASRQASFTLLRAAS